MPAPSTERRGRRAAALAWCALHAPVAIALFAGPMAQAIHALPPRFAPPLWPAFVAQALALSLLAFLATLPFSFWPAAHRVAVPVVTALATFALAVDALLYRMVGFHVNAFFFQVALQPGALAEVGVRGWQAAGGLALGAAFVALEVVAFRRFERAFSRPRRTWAWAAALLAVAAGERLGVAALAFWGGPGVFAAGQVLPLQAPVRMNGFLARHTGRQSPGFGVGDTLPDPFSGAARAGAERLPQGVDPAAIRFARRPDVVFVVGESFPADFLDEATMPRLLARAAREGAVFERHYAGASNTFHGLFSLVYGLNGHKAEAVVGAGRSPLLFRAVRANGYRMHFVCASSADWMNLKDSVFGDVGHELETEWVGPREQRDDEMIRRSARWLGTVRADEPVFLFLFFSGTHFDYFYPPRSAVFAGAWDGKGGSLGANAAGGPAVKLRARNAAHEVDWKLEELLADMEARRGRRPLVVFSGDHGEEFREKGRMGHGSAVTREQIHTPLVIAGEGVPRGRFAAPTTHADVVPTLLELLGDGHDPASYSDGISAFRASADRFVLATVGWEPRYAAIGAQTKVIFSPLDVSIGRVRVTDPDDRPVADSAARFAKVAPTILRMLGGEPSRTAAR
jgi:membrane-anchored protein YejM (alkaline phosphatase superfamily)